MHNKNRKEVRANMRMLRQVEEIKHPFKTLQIEPDLFKPTIMQISMMRTEYIDHGLKGTDVFVDLVRKEGIMYLLIYIWNSNIAEEKYIQEYKQLVCSPGYRLSEEEEELLVSVCLDENARIDENLLLNIIEEYDFIFPDTHIRLYEEKPLLSLLHMYACMYHGVRELLFKANLPFIAGEIHFMDGLNVFPIMKKGSPVDLFNKGFTTKILRILNTEWGVKELLTEEKRQITVETYKIFHRRLGGYSTITHSQWLYLKFCRKDPAVFNLQKFRLFGKDKTNRLFQNYIIFMAKCRIINRYIEFERNVTDEYKLNKYMVEADYYLSYVTNRDEYDHHIWMEKNRLQYLDYNDEDEEFFVTHPCSVQDIFDESLAQQNCLMTMYKDICRGNIDIGFMRDKAKPDKPLITFQVADGKEVVQVVGKCNRHFDPFSEEMCFFNSVYMKEKGFKYAEDLDDWIDGPPNFGRLRAYGLLGNDDIPFM